MTMEARKSAVVAGLGSAATGVSAAITASAVWDICVATIMSAIAGTTGAAVAASLGMAGTAGAASVASGMATVGCVARGMATGAITSAAAPIATVAALGYGLFKLFED